MVAYQHQPLVLESDMGIPGGREDQVDTVVTLCGVGRLRAASMSDRKAKKAWKAASGHLSYGAAGLHA